MKSIEIMVKMSEPRGSLRHALRFHIVLLEVQCDEMKSQSFVLQQPEAPPKVLVSS